jgi:hypothetical protein
MAHARGLMGRDFSLAPEPLEEAEGAAVAPEEAEAAAKEAAAEEEEVIAGLARLATGDGFGEKEKEGEGKAEGSK